jgi:hypothetical protein
MASKPIPTLPDDVLELILSSNVPVGKLIIINYDENDQPQIRMTDSPSGGMDERGHKFPGSFGWKSVPQTLELLTLNKTQAGRLTKNMYLDNAFLFKLIEVPAGGAEEGLAESGKLVPKLLSHVETTCGVENAKVIRMAGVILDDLKDNYPGEVPSSKAEDPDLTFWSASTMAVAKGYENLKYFSIRLRLVPMAPEGENGYQPREDEKLKSRMDEAFPMQLGVAKALVDRHPGLKGGRIYVKEHRGYVRCVKKGKDFELETWDPYNRHHLGGVGAVGSPYYLGQDVIVRAGEKGVIVGLEEGEVKDPRPVSSAFGWL